MCAYITARTVAFSIQELISIRDARITADIALLARQGAAYEPGKKSQQNVQTNLRCRHHFDET